MKKKSVAFWIFFILAVICIIYAVIVRSTGSGTSFFLMWAGIGIVLLLLGISFQMEFWKNVPHVVKVIGMVVVCIGIVSFVFVEGCVISQMHAKGKAGLDYIIVLGAQVRENGPSPVLKYRLDKAVEYLEENPDTICIVSGGQGKNEPWVGSRGHGTIFKKAGNWRESYPPGRSVTDDRTECYKQSETDGRRSFGRNCNK